MHGRRVLTSLLVLPIFLACIFWRQGHWLAVAYSAVFFVLARAELYSLMGARPKFSLTVWQGALAALFFFFLVPHSFPLLFAITFLFFWGSCAITMNYPLQGSRFEMAAHALALFYLIFPLASYIYLRTLPSGPSLLFFMLAVPMITDIGGFYGGSLFGRHKLASTISPKKTWEGAIVGTLSACLVVGVVAYIQSARYGHTLWFPEPNRYGELLVVTVIMSIIGQIGDLAESAMKRDAGIKDSGSSLTGHGGFLDMADAMLWIGPAMLVYYQLFFSK